MSENNRNIRIRTLVDPNKSDLTRDSSGKNYLKVKLEQDFDFLEILSLNISQEEVYKRFCSDYGVVVGRVIMNNGVGVPNAKVSIFVPLDAVDAEDEELNGLYPFSTIMDKDFEGKRYNLLPEDQQFGCHTPVGTMPSKREVLDNDKMLDVHCKYYKYTAVTNASGDFMIFGVPVGTWNMNVDVDLSDIGIYSQRPYDFIREGQPKKAFDSVTKFKGGDDLDKLIQIKNRKTSVNVRPFWGDLDQCEIGITRADVDLKHDIKPSAIFMGSIFGDNEKNSINKRCRPRKKLGNLCETIAGAGSVEMLRKNLDGKNERFDAEGGRVINEDGAWAYQVPMNLDYMITNEFGDLVPSPDPSRGIPTRSRVRFRVGMDVTGGEGRLRTRAKYLVPHNPNTYSESDYSFDDSTTDTHFRDMYWNKIYSVKNFIPRFQTVSGVDKRTFTGIKDVDDCPGLHNPFPFNRMDSDINPLFSILCIIISIISFIVVLINSIILTLINSIILILNIVLAIICEVVFFIGKIVCGLKHLTSATKRKNCRIKACIGDCSGDCKNCDCGDIIPYIPCITLDCQGDGYGPGCIEGGKPLPWHVTDKPPMKHWPDDGHPDHAWNSTVPPGDGGWAFCASIALAEALDVWEFDFYNDWVNGTLFAFLLKYKKKRKGKEKFCEFDCDDFGGGVDGNDDGNPDNKCKKNWLIDSCVENNCNDEGVKCGTKDLIKDGLIKSYEDELYYAAYTHNGDYKLFATDIIDLGAVFECDWQGKPKIQDQLIPTSYLTPELLNEYDDVTGEIVTSGYDSASIGKKYSLFFEINCLGIFTDDRHCQNIKRACEIGMGLNEDRTDEQTVLGCVPTGGGSGDVWSPNSGQEPVLDNCDVDNLFIRDVFTDLNNPFVGIDLTNTNTVNKHALFGSSAYNSFRAYSANEVSQPRGGSYYFYFGLNPGKTALDLMNNKYFEECSFPVVNDFVITGIITDVTTYNGTDGAIDITIVGGVGPYTYIWSNGATTEDISGVPAGTYTVTVTDSQGLQATTSFTVGQPFPVTCFAIPTPVSMSTASDGSIQFVGIGGGTGPYDITISGPVTQTALAQAGPTYTFNGLPTGTYTTTVTDTSGQTCTQTGITITTPPPLVITASTTNVSCFGGGDGTLTAGYVTGVPPVTWSITGPPNPPLYPSGYNSTTTTNTGLIVGTYTVTATDNIGQTQTLTFTISQPSQITANITGTDITCNGAADGTITVSGVAGGNGGYTYSWDGPTPSPIPDTTPTLGGIGTTAKPAGTYTCTITDSQGCQTDVSFLVQEPPVLSVSLVSTTDVTCNGGSDGSFTVAAAGGNPAIGNGTYQYLITSPSTVGPQASDTFAGLAADTYTVIAVDQNGCPCSSINVTINEPPVVNISVITQTTDSITVSASGGNGGPFEFRHRTTSGPGSWSSWTTNPVRSGLSSATSYDLQARDVNGCTSSIISHSTD